MAPSYQSTASTIAWIETVAPVAVYHTVGDEGGVGTVRRTCQTTHRPCAERASERAEEGHVLHRAEILAGNTTHVLAVAAVHGNLTVAVRDGAACSGAVAHDTTRVGSVGCIGCRDLTTLQSYARNLGTRDGSEEHVVDVRDGEEMTVERTRERCGYGTDGSPRNTFQVDGSRQFGCDVSRAAVDHASQPLEVFD